MAQSPRSTPTFVATTATLPHPDHLAFDAIIISSSYMTFSTSKRLLRNNRISSGTVESLMARNGRPPTSPRSPCEACPRPARTGRINHHTPIEGSHPTKKCLLTLKMLSLHTCFALLAMSLSSSRRRAAHVCGVVCGCVCYIRICQSGLCISWHRSGRHCV